MARSAQVPSRAQQTARFASSWTRLLRAFPEYVEVSALPLPAVGMTAFERKSEQLRVCSVLWEQGVLSVQAGTDNF